MSKNLRIFLNSDEIARAKEEATRLMPEPKRKRQPEPMLVSEDTVLNEPSDFAEAFDTQQKLISEPKIFYTPTRYVYRDPARIPPRQWLYGMHYIRSFVTMTIAPGGSGKSSLVLAEALAMTTGIPFLGFSPIHPLNVWYFGGEDPREETERRVAAHIKHHKLNTDHVSENLMFDSGRDIYFKIATIEGKDGFKIAVPISVALIEAIQQYKIDVLIIDPFVSCHTINENDNPMIDAVVKEFGRIAGITNCSIELVHHTRKNNGNEVTSEDARGAKSMIDGIRSQRAINVMTKEDCGLAQVPESKRRAYFRVGDEKLNMKPAGEVNWYHLTSVDLGNRTELYPAGDNVAAVEKFTFPGLLDGISVSQLRTAQDIVSAGNYRDNQQAKEWAGHAIGAKIGINTREKGGKDRMNKILSIWKANEMFVVIEEKDQKGNLRPMLRVGKLVDSTD
jgi:hypothetical protein